MRALKKQVTLVYSVSRILKWLTSPFPKTLIERVEGSATKEKIVWMLSSKNFEKSRQLLFPKIIPMFRTLPKTKTNRLKHKHCYKKTEYKSEIPVANHKGKRLKRICKSK